MDKQQKLIHIDSSKRYNGSSSDFQMRFTYPTPIKRRLKILQVEFPNTMYPINENNNTIIWLDSTGTIKTSIIPVGTYPSNIDYEKAVRDSMDDISPSVISVIYNPVTFKLKFGSDIGPFQILAAHPDFTAHGPLGLEKVDRIGGISYTADMPIDKSGPNNVFIHTDIQTNSFTTDGLRDILFKLPIDQNFGGVVYYPKFPQEWITLASSISLNDFSVKVKDKDGVLVDLNNFDWQMTLLVE